MSIFARVLIVATLALGACATIQSNNFAGEPIERVARKIGFPTRVMELPDGRRTYQWDITQTAQVGPLRPSLRGLVLSTSGDAGVGIGLDRDTVTTGVCTYTLTAAPVGETYIVEPFPVGNPGCLS